MIVPCTWLYTHCYIVIPIVIPIVPCTGHLNYYYYYYYYYFYDYYYDYYYVRTLHGASCQPLPERHVESNVFHRSSLA